LVAVAVGLDVGFGFDFLDELSERFFG